MYTYIRISLRYTVYVFLYCFSKARRKIIVLISPPLYRIPVHASLVSHQYVGVCVCVCVFKSQFFSDDERGAVTQ